MKKLFILLGKILLILLILGVIYLLTLCFPQAFFKNKLTVNNITVYSNEDLPENELKTIVNTASAKVKKSNIYKENIKYNVFFVNNPILWSYFSSRNYKAAGIDYVGVNNIFFRKVNIKENQVFGNSGKTARGDRTLDYFLAHEMTHSLEFYSMPWYKYPLNTNWLLEGYSEYIGHNSETYEEALNRYLTYPENTGEKYYTRARTLIAYLLEKEKIKPSDLWLKVNDYDTILKEAIPDDKPNIEN
jgi:hypothetical protein